MVEQQQQMQMSTRPTAGEMILGTALILTSVIIIKAVFQNEIDRAQGVQPSIN